MSQRETLMSQNLGSSMLSAEAESFVPGSLKASGGPPGPGPGLHQVPGPHGPGPGSNRAQQMQAENSQLTAQQISQLPRYLTSCYPFVKGENHNATQGSARGASAGGWHGPGRPPTPQYGGQPRMPSPQNGHFGYNQRGHTPRIMKGQGTNAHQMYSVMPHGAGSMLHSPRTISPIPRSLAPSPGGVPHNPPGLIGQPVPGLGPVSPTQPNINPYIPYLHTMGLHPGGTGAVWAPQVGHEYPSQCAGPPVSYPQYQYSGQEWGTSTEPTKCTERKKKKKAEISSNMVSIGIQNESGVGHNPAASKKKSKTKTIICRHADTQTDFSDEIANMTLAEKPCPLYHKDNRSRSWRQHYTQDSSTDSEEKDSDSGYSSPLHRRNQANNGTHPVVGITPYCPTAVPVLPVPPMHQNLRVGSGSTLHQLPHPGAGLLPQPPMYHSQYVPTSMATPYSGYTQTQNLMGTNTAPSYQTSYPSLQPTSVPTSLHLGHSTANHDTTAAVAPPSSSTVSNPITKSMSNPLLARLGSANTEPEDEETSSGKKKRRRSRRKKRASSSEDIGALSDEPYDMHRAHSSSNVSRTSENDLALQFDDEDEFPNLLSAAGGLPSSTNSQSSGPISYSDILKSHVPSRSLDSSISSSDRLRFAAGADSQSAISSDYGHGKESKNSRKRRKRRELASRAADEELAEISLEQTVLKELRSKSLKDGTKHPPAAKEPVEAPPPPQPKAQPPGKKSKQPISLNFADMITALEKQHEEDKVKKQQQPVVSQRDHSINKSHVVANPMDSTAPAKRGKEREVPKVKKPSPLKKVILKEREEKKRLRLLEESNPMSPGAESSESSQLPSVAGMALDSDLSQDAMSSKTSSMDYVGTPVSAEMSPISQTSPISMSPLSGSPLSSGVNSPIAGNNIVPNQSKSSVLMKIHSRRFREYCNQVLDKDIDACCTLLLQDLVRFQDRLYHKDPTKAKSRRRIVLGLREVTKHLKLNRIKCVIISPNMERIQSKGGLDEALNNILDLCSAQDIPFVFALGRRALGRACAKLVPVSVAGIFNFEGSEENFGGLMKLSEKARSQYKEMVTLLEKEMEEAQQAPYNSNTTANISGFTQLFPHLGHSRTPSACSAISFTSSILSEPISENYPHSEPETDSRGYEIVRDKVKAIEDQKEQAATTTHAYDDDDDLTSDSLQSSQEKVVIVESLDDIGHEADTEADEDEDVCNRRKKASVSCAGLSDKETLDNSQADDSDTESADSAHQSLDANSIIEKDDIELPHIDSIHSIVDLNTEIQSQHSSKTLDLNEVLSTHSSKTLEADRGGYTTPDRSSKNMGSTTDLREPSAPGSATGSGGSSRLRNVDNQERVQSWVADTQKQLELIGQCPDENEEMAINNNPHIEATKCCDTNETSNHISTEALCKDAIHTNTSPCESIQTQSNELDNLTLTLNGHVESDSNSTVNETCTITT